MVYSKSFEKKVVKILRRKNRKIQELKEKNKKLKYYASIDHLTKVINKGTGMRLLSKNISKISLNERDLSICFIDIDNLKYINDTFGHIEGDKTIVKVSKILKRNIRKNDFVFRAGGDEFIIVFPDTNINQSKLILKRINNEIAKLNEVNNFPYNLSISYGFAEFNNKNKDNMKKLIKSADQDMYLRKQILYKKIKKC